MARQKNYTASLKTITEGFETVENDIYIDLPRNPRNHKKLDHTKYLGLGFDAWAIQSLHVIRTLLHGENFSVATLISYSSNGLRYFLAFLAGGAVESPPATPNNLSKRHLERFVSWLDRKSTRLNSSHLKLSRMQSSA